MTPACIVTTFQTKVPAYLLCIYFLLIGIQLPLPLLKEKTQLSDIWFLILLAYFIFQLPTFIPIVKKCLLDKYLLFLIYTGLIYLLINTASVFYSFSSEGIIELTGKFYLFLMCGVVFLYLLLINNTHQIFHFFLFLGFSLAIFGVIGWLLSVLGFPNESTQIYLDYPYLGDTHRLKAFTTTPSMYISLISICIAFSLSNYLFFANRKYLLVSALFFTVSAVLTFTKSFVLIIAVWLILYLFKYFKRPILITASFSYLACILVFLSHFLIIHSNQQYNKTFTESPYTSNEVLSTINEYSIIGSGYYSFKKTAWKLFTQFPIIGLGPGNYNLHVARLKTEDKYPLNLPKYDPHSTYLGALAETGLFGFVALILLGFSIIRILLKLNIWYDSFSFLLFLLFCLMIIEAISMDVMNFRHYWIVVSIILYQYYRTEDTYNSPSKEGI